jgi:hypothetical protein
LAHPDAYYRKIILEDADGAWDCTDPQYPVGDGAELAVPPDPPLHFLSVAEMRALPEPEWLVDGLVMAETSALMFGKSNSFKSFLADRHRLLGGNGAELARSPGQQPRAGALRGHRRQPGVAKQRIPGWLAAHQIPAEDEGGISLYPREIAIDDDAAHR